jgi:hypothetical protein
MNSAVALMVFESLRKVENTNGEELNNNRRT